ncbi:MAG TPA: guanylate kinase [Phycisphaerales bacterium]|nr:guanylate kinase [Phycisphaerales bacterium]
MPSEKHDTTPPSGSAHRLPTDTDNGMLLIISGPSGVGKTTITRAIERSIPDAVFSVSYTTRPVTGVDVDGVDYHFVNTAEFDRRAAAGEFIETAVFAGNQYGTPLAPIKAQIGRGRLMILEIDVEGAKQVKAKMPEAYGVFILPPSEEVLLGRLRDRKREPEEVIQRRFQSAQREIAEARSCGAYSAFIVNDNLERAIGEALRLVREHRAGLGRKSSTR